MALSFLGRHRVLRPGRDIAWKEFFKRLWDEFNNDAVDDIAATITFYAVLALFPFLLFMVGVVSKVVSWETIDDVVRQLSHFAPGEVTTIISERLTALKSQPATGLLTVSFLGAIWAASAGVSSLIPALDRAYNVVETRPFWKRRLLAIGTTLAMGVVSLVASLIAIAVPAVARWVGGALGTLLDWARLPIAGVLVMLTWGALYAWLPNVKPRFQPVTPGSVVGVLLWVAASWGFSLYVRYFGSYEATYGALGGVVVLLLWMWVSSMALLLGAEINQILMPAEEQREVDTHVTNMPATAMAQRGDPTLNREGLVDVEPTEADRKAAAEGVEGVAEALGKPAPSH